MPVATYFQGFAPGVALPPAQLPFPPTAAPEAAPAPAAAPAAGPALISLAEARARIAQSHDNIDPVRPPAQPKPAPPPIPPSASSSKPKAAPLAFDTGVRGVGGKGTGDAASFATTLSPPKHTAPLPALGALGKLMGGGKLLGSGGSGGESDEFMRNPTGVYGEGVDDGPRRLALGQLCGGAHDFENTKLLLEGPLFKRCRTGGRVMYQFILTSHSLIYAEASVTTPGGEPRYKMHKALPLMSVRVDASADASAAEGGGEQQQQGWSPETVESPFLTEFAILSPMKSFAVVAPDGPSRRRWLVALDAGSRAVCAAFRTPHLSRSDPALRLASVWRPDADAKACECCGEAFRFLSRRRHHCRACGKVVCAPCSSQRAFLGEGDGEGKGERICNLCYFDQQQRNEEKDEEAEKQGAAGGGADCGADCGTDGGADGGKGGGRGGGAVGEAAAARARLGDLEAAKAAAIAGEDFARAAEIKKQIVATEQALDAAMARLSAVTAAAAAAAEPVPAPAEVAEAVAVAATAASAAAAAGTLSAAGAEAAALAAVLASARVRDDDSRCESLLFGERLSGAGGGVRGGDTEFKACGSPAGVRPDGLALCWVCAYLEALSGVDAAFANGRRSASVSAAAPRASTAPSAAQSEEEALASVARRRRRLKDARVSESARCKVVFLAEDSSSGGACGRPAALDEQGNALGSCWQCKRVEVTKGRDGCLLWVSSLGREVWCDSMFGRVHYPRGVESLRALCCRRSCTGSPPRFSREDDPLTEPTYEICRTGSLMLVA